MKTTNQTCNSRQYSTSPLSPISYSLFPSYCVRKKIRYPLPKFAGGGGTTPRDPLPGINQNRYKSPLNTLSPLYFAGLALMKNCRHSSHKLTMIKLTLNPLYCSLYGILMQHHGVQCTFLTGDLVTIFTIVL